MNKQKMEETVARMSLLFVTSGYECLLMERKRKEDGWNCVRNDMNEGINATVTSDRGEQRKKTSCREYNGI